MNNTNDKDNFIPCLELKGLAAGYGQQTIVRDVSFAVPVGTITTLIGPNGAGKSTLLRTIAAQLAPQEGTVFLDGRKLKEYPAAELAKRESLLMTERIRPELLSVRDVVAMGRYPYTGRMGHLTAADEEVVSCVMDECSVVPLEGRDYNELSDGQKQRVLFARALAQEPSLLVMDEPTSYLDIHYQLAMMDLLAELAHRRGMTIVMSLHELSLAREVSDQVICVKDDGIYAIGTPAEIFTDDRIAGLYDISGADVARVL